MTTPKWLAKEQFDLAVEALPLVSADLCFVSDGKLLLGKRNNKPAQGWWFTPGGRIRKGEPWSNALRRIAQEEVGMSSFAVSQALLMGVWDHFYDDSAFNDYISTHYVNLPYYYPVQSEQVCKFALPFGKLEQHDEWRWVSIESAASDLNVHSNVRVYAHWLLDKDLNKKQTLVHEN